MLVEWALGLEHIYYIYISNRGSDNPKLSEKIAGMYFFFKIVPNWLIPELPQFTDIYVNTNQVA